MIRPTKTLALLFVVAAGCATPSTDSPKSDSSVVLFDGPTAAPALVAPGFISTVAGERDAAFTPDQNEFYYTVWTGRFGVVVESHIDGDSWTVPKVASFSGTYSDLEPFITFDGKRLYFASNRPDPDSTEADDYNIWYVERSNDTWAEPIRLGDHVNTDANEFYPSLDRDGRLFYTAAYENSIGGEDIWMSEPVDGQYGPRQNVGPWVNTQKDEFNATISTDGTILIYSSFGREDGTGGGDLYVSFREEDGSLGPGCNPGEPINSSALDFSPALSPDGQMFIFSSRRTNLTSPATTPHTYGSLMETLSSPGNGDLDIYQVSVTTLLEACR